MKLKLQSVKEQKPAGRSLKKNLAIATIAASLGISLGVPVGDVLADGAPGTPPALSRQDKESVAPGQVKISNQTEISGKAESSQVKMQSSQGKVESSQGKARPEPIISRPEPIISKGQKVESKPENQVNK